jgi:hypothetical protein
MIIATAANAANGNAHAIVRAKHATSKCERRGSHGYCFSGSFEKITAVHCHSDPCVSFRFLRETA